MTYARTTQDTAHPYCPDEAGRCQYGMDEICPGIGRCIDAGEDEGEYVGDHTEDISYKFTPQRPQTVSKAWALNKRNVKTTSAAGRVLRSATAMNHKHNYRDGFSLGLEYAAEDRAAYRSFATEEAELREEARVTDSSRSWRAFKLGIVRGYRDAVRTLRGGRWGT